MGKLKHQALNALLTKPPRRYPDGEGLHFKTIGKGRAYWTYRFTLHGKETEISLGTFPEMSLDTARITHMRACADVAEGMNPVVEKRAAKAAVAQAGKAALSQSPTFGQWADQFIAKREVEWKNAKHRQQWLMTLREYCAPIRDLPVDQIDAPAILRVLEPIWSLKPETASRLRGRIEAVMASAQVAGHIDQNRPNPARWKNWLDHMLPQPRKIGKIDHKTGDRVARGNHAALPHEDVPAFMARLGETPGVAALALRLTILTACRTSEVLGATYDEVDFDTATWLIPKERMKMGKPHRVPLSAPALAIVRAQHEIRGRNPHVFPGRPMKPLSNMSMAMLLRRMGSGDITVHGFRSSFRNWATEVEKVEYATAERCLAHAIGSDAALSYDRSDRLELRRPVMSAWSDYVCGADASNVIPLIRA
jgi:integrase